MEDSSVTPNDGIDRHLNRSTNSISVAKLLKDVEKSYEPGKSFGGERRFVVYQNLITTFRFSCE